ncbi:hypothetical protein Tco_0617402 [Tanacetum coccineum]
MVQQQHQQIVLADQLVPKFQSIGRCNNYDVLQNIPCSVECKIVRQILIDNALSYALTTSADEITYTVDMFRATLKLPVETPDNPFIKPADLKFIQIFLKIVGYEGIVNKVNAFYTKNLAQPWKMMFKVFNRCLTTRTSGQDQTKINILQIFHVGINCTHVDYAALLWWDFLHYKFHSIPQRIEEDYHSIKDDIPLYKEYVKVFVRADVPTIQSQPVEYTQGTNRTLRSTRTPTPTAEVAQKKRKSKAVAGESSTPRKSLKVIIKQKKPSTTPIPPPSDDRERDEITKATLLSLTMHKTAIVAEAQENVAKVQEKILEEDIEKMVDGKDEESYDNAFVDLVFQDKEDISTMIEPRNHKEHPEIVDDDVVDDKVEETNDDEEEKKDDNDDDDNDDHALVRGKVSSSSKTRKEKMQTPNPPPPRSIRNDLSSNNTFSEELTVNVSPIPDTTSKDPSMEQLTNTFITKEYFEGKMKEMSDTFNNLVPELTIAKTNELMKEVIPRMVKDAIIEELFKLHMKNKVLNVHPTVSISTAKITVDLKQQLYLKMKTDLQAQAANPEIWDVLKKKFEKSSASAQFRQSS